MLRLNWLVALVAMSDMLNKKLGFEQQLLAHEARGLQRPENIANKDGFLQWWPAARADLQHRSSNRAME